MPRFKNDFSRYRESVRENLVNAKIVSTYRRILCVWLRILGHEPEHIADIIGWSTSNVQKVQSLFLREGEKAFENPGRGGGLHRYLSEKDEKNFINSLRDRNTGMIYLSATEIKDKFEEYAKVPKGSVSCSTIYRLLKRHGYKKGIFNNGERAFYR